VRCAMLAILTLGVFIIGMFLFLVTIALLEDM
jgi:hypothetical protein